MKGSQQMPSNPLQVIDEDSLLTLHYKISTAPQMLMKDESGVDSFEVLSKKFELKKRFRTEFELYNRMFAKSNRFRII
jgi:hypothetical protein